MRAYVVAGLQDTSGAASSGSGVAYGAITLYDGPSQEPSARNEIGNFLRSDEATPGIPYNPGMT